ncbi:MAG: hypothetical protein Kow0027_12710 [Saprospiraceae bacterium]
MKNLFKIIPIVFSFALLFTVGCQDEGTGGGGNDIGPLVQIVDGPNPGDVITELNGTISVTLDVTKGTSPLNTVTIQENGTKLDLSRIEYVGVSGSANPLLLSGANKDGFTQEIRIQAQDAYDTRTYTIKVEDEAGLSDEVSFDITIVEPIEKTLTGVLWNQGGPAGKGGIDLDDGSSTGSKLSSTGDPAVDTSYLRAEMRDMGIDSLAGSGDNWRRRVAGINGSEVRFLGNSLPDFNFDNITTKEAILSAFEAAAPLSETLPNWGSFKVSHEVAEGDIFVVKKGEKYYLVKVDVVVETTVLGDNTDHYEVSIKY